MTDNGEARVTALVAEDEAPQRRALHEQLLQAWPGLEVVAVCEDGISALEAVQERCPDVAFLDIRMPGVSGLDVAREVVARGGLVVFTTAYDDYAVKAFEAGAADYLLKPVQMGRLEQAVERLRERLAGRQARDGGADLRSLIDDLDARLRPQGERLIRWITASAGDSVRMIGIDEVLFFQASEKYVRVVTASGEGVIRTPLKELLAGLDPDEFWQVHRGTVVRVQAIDRVTRNELGRYVLSLKNHGERLVVSAAFVHRFRGM
ncbi:LytTR family DNA-binding domain-containing protein [Pseudoxanthomonas sp. J35]|uniref:LytR/AlgR family response regulator transcription factor n=1 Tax=Pseudoxanthomonas sp. J35 TaxID=935852 RepID=UPI0004901859|nr:LytTR family DNA-binding domain-containing protein [Pseudoxanthomonas sp. J35]